MNEFEEFLWLSWMKGDKLFFDKESFEILGKGEFKFVQEDENISAIWFPSSIDRLLLICWSKL